MSQSDTLTKAKPEDFVLKAIKHNERLSEETNCYSANLYFKGKLIAEVSNRGHGGCDEFHQRGELSFKEVAEIVAETFPKLENHYVDKADPERFYACTLEIVCGDLVNQYLRDKQIKSITRGKVAFILEDGECYTVKHCGDEAAAIKHVKTKHPKAKILNGMDIKAAGDLLYKDETT